MPDAVAARKRDSMLGNRNFRTEAATARRRPTSFSLSSARRLLPVPFRRVADPGMRRRCPVRRTDSSEMRIRFSPISPSGGGKCQARPSRNGRTRRHSECCAATCLSAKLKNCSYRSIACSSSDAEHPVLFVQHHPKNGESPALLRRSFVACASRLGNSRDCDGGGHPEVVP